MRRGRWSLARQLLILQLVVVGVLVVASAVFAYLEAVRATEDSAAEKVMSVALSVADAPSVPAALRTENPTTRLQPFAERVRADTEVDFITIMSLSGIRYTHPNPRMIGKTFVGNRAEALRGRAFIETYTGTLGPSIRAVVPVFDTEGRVTALVSVGITLRAVTAELNERLAPLAAVAAAVTVVGIAGAALVSARLRRQTRGVAPAELAMMFEYYEAILHAVREGLVLVDADGRVSLANDAAGELLGLPERAEGVAVSDLGLPAELAEAVTAASVRTDEIHVTDERVLLVNVAPVRSRGRAMGTVVTLRDHTDLQRLSGELSSARGFTESLRSQAHEAANRLHTVVSLVELGRTEEAVAFATAELDLAQRLTDQVMDAVSDPVVAAVLLGKSAEAGERGIELQVHPDTRFSDSGSAAAIDSRDLVTILGNLIDNALDAAAGARVRGKVTVLVRETEDELTVEVADNGPGLDADARRQAFRRGWSTKPARDGLTGRGLGLALVGQAVRRHRGTVTAGNTADGAVFTVVLPLRAGERT